MAFDITKSLATQVLPKTEAPSFVDKAAPLRTPFKPEKQNAPTRSFQEELASEPAKVTQPKKEVDAKAAQAKKAIDSGSDASTPIKQINGPKTELVDLRLDEAVPVGNQSLDGLVDNNIQDILQSPVAALLAGNLQSLGLEELTSLIGKNELLSSVLFGSDSEAVLEQLNQPTDVLESLNLSPEFLEELKNSTGEVDLQNISAMQVFAALGFDKTAVLDQINALRAQISGQQPLFVTGEDQLLTQANLNAPDKKDGLNVRKASDAIKTEVRSTGLGIPSSLPTVDEGLFEGVLPNDTEKNAGPEELASAATQAVGKNFVEVNSSGKAAVDAVSVEAKSPLDQFDVFKQWKDSSNQNLAVPGPIGEQVTNVSNQVVTGSVPQGKSATFDGFFELGKKIDQLNSENVTTIDGKQIVVQKSASESVRAPNFMDAVIGRFGANMIQGNDGLKSQASPLGTLTATVPTNPLTEGMTPSGVKEAEANIQPPKDLMNFGAQFAAVNSNTPKSSVDQPVRKLTVDEFMGDVTAGRINFDFNKPESDSFQGSSEENDSLPFTGDKLAATLGGAESKTPAFGSEFGALMEKPDLASGMTSSQRAELTQKVMDSANYLVREGAGSVKLDLSTTDLGTLQIAINLSDNKVDIKVFTESDPVREAMIADLSRLKDALQTQNVNLNQVQVGVGERFGNSSSFDQSQQFSKHQEFRETFAENMKQSAARAVRELDVRDIAPPSIMNRMNQISSDGRVQIRV